VRIYEGSPRQQWEEVLRSIGAFADREALKELLLLEMEAGFVLQGLGLQAASADSDSFGTAVKRTYELTDDQVGELIDAREAERGSSPENVPHADITNYYEHAMRVIGRYVDSQKPHDVFLFEQDGSFVLRLFGVAGSRVAHQLAEFTRDEILAMIEAAPEQRQHSAPKPTGAP
jgi:hypothetical protein